MCHCGQNFDSAGMNENFLSGNDLTGVEFLLPLCHVYISGFDMDITGIRSPVMESVLHFFSKNNVEKLRSSKKIQRHYSRFEISTHCSSLPILFA